MGKFSAVAVIARLTFREAARRWVLWVALALGVLFLAIYAIGFHEIEKDILRQTGSRSSLLAAEMHNFFLLAGMYVVNFLTSIMTVLTSVDTLSGEITSGTIHTVVSKPVPRWQIVLGKWLGFTGMLTLYLLLMAGGVALVGYLVAGTVLPNLVQGGLLMWLTILLLLGVSMVGGTRLSTLANGVLVFGLYGIAFIGGWIEQFGAFMNSPAAVNVGIVTSLILPSEAMWRRAAFEMQSALVGAIGVSPFASNSAPSLVMVGYAVLYAVTVLWLAMGQFSRRDL
ncbi:MAG TPA: ABC transporter permease [Anaerolineales bacterium]|nr:ABC transporter permease [Anaerolineales bacterium]